MIVPDQPEPHPEHVSSDVRTEDDDEPIEDHSEGEQAQGQEPEPDEDINLFIYCNIIRNNRHVLLKVFGYYQCLEAGCTARHDSQCFPRSHTCGKCILSF